MALLSFRLSIVFTIGLLLLNGFTSESPSVLAFVNTEGPERLRLIAAPPAHVIVTGTRNAPVYLPCQAELDPGMSDGIPNSSSYGDDDYPDEHMDEDDEEDGEDEGYDEDFIGQDDEDEEEVEEGEEDETVDEEGRFPSLSNNELVATDDDETGMKRSGITQQKKNTEAKFLPDGSELLPQEEEKENDEERTQPVQRHRRRKRYVRAPGRGFSGMSRSGGYYDGNSFEYAWYRNGHEFLTTSFQNQNQRQMHKGFRLYENGTLRIPYNRQNGNIAAGVYWCKATLVQQRGRYQVQGSIRSTECVVSIAYLERDNRFNYPNNTITTRANIPIVLPCPFQSYPAANITWSLNKVALPLHGSVRETRYFLLQNGSLLISDVQPSDSGRFRCNATNNYVAKNVRSTSMNLLVLLDSGGGSPLAGTNETKRVRLLPPLQELQQSVFAGDTLRLHCACYFCKPQWTFTPHQSQIPIALDNFTHQVTFVNVSVERHEGVFSCRTPDGAEVQTFNVTVLVAPTFLTRISSFTSSVMASMAFNCSVAGNPRPTVTWYKNGREVRSNHIIHYNYPLLRINTIDPEDEGLYQCMAKNAAGHIAASAYLWIRDKQKYRHKAKRPEAIRCYPVDTTSLYLTFGMPNQASLGGISYMMYYMASDDPVRWFSSAPTQLAEDGSLRISGSMVEPLRNYTVFLRACSLTDWSGNSNDERKKVLPSRLSRAVRCSSQGYPILSTLFPNNGIFIWWPRYDGVQPTAFIIQLRSGDGTTNLTASFTNEIIGTVDPLDDYMTYEELEPLLGRISAEKGESQEWVWNGDSSEDITNMQQRQQQQQQHEQQEQQHRRRKRRRRRRRQSHRDQRWHDRPTGSSSAFALSKDRKQIFDSLATSIVDIDPSTVEALRRNASSVDAETLASAAKQQQHQQQQHQQQQQESSESHRNGNARQHQQITITRFKVAGNVTGILLPNVHSVMVRVLGSIAPDGEPMEQDLRYVPWKSIDVAAPRADAINRFQASHIDARSVQFTWSRFIATKLPNRCLHLCYKNVNYDVFHRGGTGHLECQKIPTDATHYNVKDLLPVTMYKAFLKPCDLKEALSVILDFQTKHDVPGPVTNHELHRKDGKITITWGPPENRNGVLHGYIVEWINEDSVLHTANLTADKTSFTFPNVSSDERINISIRALSSSGIGIPIYLNLKQYFPDPDERNEASGAPPWPSQLQLVHYVLIGVLLVLIIPVSLCCVQLFHRKSCKKATSAAGPTGSVASGSAAGGAGGKIGGGRNHHHPTVSSDTAAMQMMGMMSGCNNDMHEMQTLIRSSGNCRQPNSGGDSGAAAAAATGLLANGLGSSSMYGNPTSPASALLELGGASGGTPTVLLNVTVPSQCRKNTTSGYSPMTTYKELLEMDRHRNESNDIPPVTTTTSTTATTSATIATNVTDSSSITNGDPSCIATNSQYLISNDGTAKQDSGRISTATLAYTGDRKRSPTLSFSSKSSCAALTHSPSLPSSSGASASASSSSSSSPSTPPSSLSPVSSKLYVIQSRSPSAVVPGSSVHDSSRRQLLDTTLDSNCSTCTVEEEPTVQQSLPLVKPALPSLPPISQTTYDYEYATNCDDDRARVTSGDKERQQQRQQQVNFRKVPGASIASDSNVSEAKKQLASADLTMPNPSDQKQHPLVVVMGSEVPTVLAASKRPGYKQNGTGRVPEENRRYSSRLCSNNNEGSPAGGRGIDGEDDDNDDDDDDDDDDDGEANDNDDDDEELDNSASLLNTSSLSTKPLHQQNHTSSWNFRRPIIGPNG
uniref:Putative neural cell adhesion molecule l1 n=2 Tax=Anopheles triannulatus TaxID=58253 RepID=A0A2M4A6F4_9DIPT